MVNDFCPKCNITLHPYEYFHLVLGGNFMELIKQVAHLEKSGEITLYHEKCYDKEETLK